MKVCYSSSRIKAPDPFHQSVSINPYDPSLIPRIKATKYTHSPTPEETLNKTVVNA